MNPDNEWEPIGRSRNSPIWGAGMGALRIALLFGSAAIAIALIAAPIADNKSRQLGIAGPQSLDRIVTGSAESQRIYTIRRSVLQSDPHSICIIQANGERSGAC